MRAGSRRLTYDDVLHGWVEDAAFRSWFCDTLAAHPEEAFRWETPPVTASTLTRVFEFIVHASPELVRRPDPSAFGESFVEHADGVSCFANLGGDARLVVPIPMAPHEAYGHLAAFVRKAPRAQTDALWRVVGQQMRAHVNTRPVWLSTAGAGVPWLHVRLDDRPKYYRYAPYRTA